jgi:pilus assembly protein CpaF
MGEIDRLKRKYHYAIIDELGPDLDNNRNGQDGLRIRIEQILRRLLSNEATPLSGPDKETIVSDVLDNILGYGPIEPLCTTRR